MPEVQPSPVWRHYNRPRYDNQEIDRSYTPPPENPHKFSKVPLVQLSFVGALTEPTKVAILRAPDGTLRRARLGQTLGTEQASITAISADQVQVAIPQASAPQLIPLTATPENQGECHYTAVAVHGALSHTQALIVIGPNFPNLCALMRFVQTEQPQLPDSWDLELRLSRSGKVYKPLVRLPQPTNTATNNYRTLLSSEWQQLLQTWQFPPLPNDDQRLFFTLKFTPKLADTHDSTIVK
jgi:hypothetical protein